MSNEIEKVPGGSAFAIAMQQAETIAKSGLVPASLNTPEKVYVAIQTGAEAGLSPMAAVRSVYVINGTPAWKGESALALIRKAGITRHLDVGAERGDGTDDGITGYFRCDLWEPHPSGNGSGEWHPIEVLYTVADAKRARLWENKGPWTQHPKDMLMWRAVGRASKRHFSEVLLGLDVAEVARDYSSSDEAPAPMKAPSEPDPLLEQLAGGREVAATIDVEPEETTADEALGTQGADASRAPQGEAVPSTLKPSQLDEPPEDYVLESSK